MQGFMNTNLFADGFQHLNEASESTSQHSEFGKIQKSCLESKQNNILERFNFKFFKGKQSTDEDELDDFVQNTQFENVIKVYNRSIKNFIYIITAL